MSSENHVYQWELPPLLNSSDQCEKNSGKYSMVILNTYIQNPEILVPLWKIASLRVVVDGGANQLYDVLKIQQLEESTDLLPHFLSGDFDSIRADVLLFFKQRHVKIIPTPHQDKTDFFKALEIVLEKNESDTIIVCCDNVGRFDQIMANINALYLAAHNPRMKDSKIYLSSSSDITWLLKPGRHVIQIPPSLWSENFHCALIPVGQPCYHVSTTGLKWNLDDDVIQFGGMVSTSNTYDMNSSKLEVNIKTDSCLMWSMGTRAHQTMQPTCNYLGGS